MVEDDKVFSPAFILAGVMSGEMLPAKALWYLVVKLTAVNNGSGAMPGVSLGLRPWFGNVYAHKFVPGMFLGCTISAIGRPVITG